MNEKIFDKINQISVLSSEIRFKILVTLFNSDIIINNKKLGIHSCSFGQLKEVVGVKGPDLDYHLDIMVKSKLAEKLKEHKGYYHITPEGKNILRMFGINSKLVKKLAKRIK